MPKVIIALFTPFPAQLRFSPLRRNPGVGGTDFTTILFAMQLAAERPDWDVVLVHHHPINLDDCPSNVRQVRLADLSELPDFLSSNRDGVLVCLAALLARLSPHRIDEALDRWVVWSRHPFDPYVRQLAQASSKAHVVCVGEYQWRSNLRRSLHVHFIQEIIRFPATCSPRVDRSPNMESPRFVHMSALTPWKGFREVAEQWPDISSFFPGAQLHVVGGADLHSGRTEHHPLIPASNSFAAELLQHISRPDIESGRVVFHGTMGEEKNAVIETCDVALLNPTGRSEAFPATPLECMCLGVPVIASDDYGMADSMRWFPELSLRRPQDMVRRIRWLLEDPHRYRVMRSRSVAVACALAANSDESMSRWLWLLEAMAESRADEVVLRPNQPLHGSLATMVWRRDVRPMAGRLKRALGFGKAKPDSA